MGNIDTARANHGYNIGLEITGCYQKYFDHRETELNKIIDSLKVTNLQIKVMSDVMNKLTHAKQTDKKFDLSKDETARKYAYLVHLRNPTVFENKIHNLPVADYDLEQKITEIIAQLKEEGVPDQQIHLGIIMEKFPFDSNIRFDVLNEETIDVVVQGLDAELKMLNADLNERLMNINSKYEDRSQMTENARQVLKEADELNKSIIQKTR
ncbi:MAG: hypothetical protein WA347_08985 [Rhabdochlamydiaceae bacterium]|jgi:hypothetical protein